jgi:hypothetical protein
MLDSEALGGAQPQPLQLVNTKSGCSYPDVNCLEILGTQSQDNILLCAVLWISSLLSRPWLLFQSSVLDKTTESRDTVNNDKSAIKHLKIVSTIKIVYKQSEQ